MKKGGENPPILYVFFFRQLSFDAFVFSSPILYHFIFFYMVLFASSSKDILPADDVLFHGFIAVFLMEVYGSASFSGGTCGSVYFFPKFGDWELSLPYGGLKMAFFIYVDFFCFC